MLESELIRALPGKCLQCWVLQIMLVPTGMWEQVKAVFESGLTASFWNCLILLTLPLCNKSPIPACREEDTLHPPDHCPWESAVLLCRPLGVRTWVWGLGLVLRNHSGDLLANSILGAQLPSLLCHFFLPCQAPAPKEIAVKPPVPGTDSH